MNIRYPIYEGVYRILTAHLFEDGILPPSKIVKFIVSQAKKERKNIWVS